MESRNQVRIIELLEQRFPEQRFRRSNPAQVRQIMDRLVVPPSPFLTEFCSRFCGPIGSDVTGFVLLDAVEENPCIVSSSEYLRRTYGLGSNWVVLTDIVGDGLFVYDSVTDHVFSIDFEGGIELLKIGKLQATHSSLASFLCWFFDFPPKEIDEKIQTE